MDEDKVSWGPSLWKSIHYIAAFYPEKPSNAQISQYKKFYTELHHVIPCHTCAQNYKVHLQQLPIEPYLKSRDLLFSWTVDLHNIVNRALNKREWSLEEARKVYIYGGSPNKTTSTSELLLVIAGTVLIIPCGLLLYKFMHKKAPGTKK